MTVDRYYLPRGGEVSREEFFARTTASDRLTMDRHQSEWGGDTIYRDAEEFASDVAATTKSNPERARERAIERWREHHGPEQPDVPR